MLRLFSPGTLSRNTSCSLFDIFIIRITMILELFTVVGAYIVTKYFVDQIWNPVLLLWKNITELFLDKTTLVQKFGSWAVVTGSTDGIGKQYAIELAKRGINIVLISRNLERLNGAAKEIEELHGVETKVIVADFTNGTAVYNHIEKELQDVTVGILVNNVGAAPDYPMKFCEENLQKKWDLIHLNVMAMTNMTHMLLPKMVKQGRGAVVNVASAASWTECLPYGAVYGATKAYVDYFTLSIQKEYAHSGVHIQVLSPFFVTTKLTAFSDFLSTERFFIPNAKTLAKSAVETLGKIEDSCGYWRHSLLRAIAQLAPAWLKDKVMSTVALLIIEDYKKTAGRVQKIN